MEKSKIKNLKIRLKAGVLTAVALIPGVSCGRNVGRQEPGANVSIETEANTEKNTSNVITTTTTKGNKTTTNTFVTESTNNNGYVNNNNNNNNNNGHVDNTTNSNTNSTEAKTENKTNPTHQNTTQKTTTVKIKNSDIKVTTTKANTPAPTTQAPTTTIKVTEPPAPTTRVEYINVSDRTDYTKYDLLNEDDFEAKSALQQLSRQFGKELFNGYVLQNQYGTSFGADEAYAIIANLNYNQGINVRALGDPFIDASEEQFLQYSDNMNLAYYQYIFGSRVDFTKYVLDEDLANFLNRVSDEYIEYMNGNTDSFTNEMNDFFENNSAYDNCVKYYFMCNTREPQNYYSNEMNEARQIYFDNVSRPLYRDLEPYKGKIRKAVYR